MSTDNTNPVAPQAGGSGKLFLGIAIGCGCSLLMALMLAAVLVLFFLNQFRVSRACFVSTPPPTMSLVESSSSCTQDIGIAESGSVEESVESADSMEYSME
ncbi:MAG: hypothetical protein FWH27_03160 [Planctomycetaceae bacterium]|nr:hypothetical protein [Planctomycetaceae bacterium]